MEDPERSRGSVEERTAGSKQEEQWEGPEVAVR